MEQELQNLQDRNERLEKEISDLLNKLHLAEKENKELKSENNKLKEKNNQFEEERKDNNKALISLEKAEEELSAQILEVEQLFKIK